MIAALFQDDSIRPGAGAHTEIPAYKKVLLIYRHYSLLATAIVAKAGNIYSGLWYPIIVAVMTFIIGSLFVRETKDTRIHEEVH